MSELKVIDGIKVLLIDNESEAKTAMANHKEVDLVVVGGLTALEKTLNGRSLGEFIKTESPKSEQLILENMQREEMFILEKLPELPEVFIDKRNFGWQGAPKWYDQKRKRRKK